MATDLRKKGTRSFGHSATDQSLFELMAPVMDSPLRRKFFDPVKTLKVAGVRPGQEILEVGCGTGFFTIHAAELVGHEGHVYAIDPHPLAIEQVSSKMRDAGLSNIGLIKANALESGLASDCIDLVLLFGVLPSPTLPLDQLLPEMSRLLKLNGILAVWTALPWWSPISLTRSGLFVYVGKENGVHSFRQGRSGPAH